MQLVTTVCPIGYSADLLALDPNLAEGMPVRGAMFVVKDGKLVSDDGVKLENGSLTQWKGDAPVGWAVDEPGTVSFKDDKVLYEGKPTLRQEQAPRKGKGAARLYQAVKVQPWHYYHVSVMIKTQDCTSTDFRILAHRGDPKGGTGLNSQQLLVKSTTDWTRLDGTFDSLDNTEVSIYIGSYAPKAGTVWWSDAKMEPGGFVNVIRRTSLPVTVTSEDGKTHLRRGQGLFANQGSQAGQRSKSGILQELARPAGRHGAFGKFADRRTKSKRQLSLCHYRGQGLSGQLLHERAQGLRVDR